MRMDYEEERGYRGRRHYDDPREHDREQEMLRRRIRDQEMSSRSRYQAPPVMSESNTSASPLQGNQDL